MKIVRLSITNVASYREKTTFEFSEKLNILIGPNGGGKTNLQRILALTLSKYFIHQYQFRKDDNTTAIEQHDPWTQRAMERAFPKYIGNETEQLIEIELKPEARDVENIKAIGGSLEKFNRALSWWERRYEQYKPLAFADAIANANTFVYRIRDLVLEEPTPQTPEWAFLEYLREFFIFLRVANEVEDVVLSSPVFFFSSERTLVRSFEVQAGQLSDQNYFDGYRSAYQAALGEGMNLLEWGTRHFVRLHRRAVNAAADSNEKTWRDYFYQYPDVKLLTRYMEQMGYDWGFRNDKDLLSYWFVLGKEGEWRTTDLFSSGEREIVHFLLAMFALNARDGIILVDEPELHLHPRWQKVFLGLFRDLAPERNNQFLITTHSPVFVTPETIDSVTRIFRVPKTGSARVTLRSVDLPQKNHLVRMINSQNNERLFFADKVVLVEGITDRLILESLLEAMADSFQISAAIEVIEVGGKHNFADYRTVVAGLRTPVFTVADLDYLDTVGDERSKKLFTSDAAKQWDILTRDKKSKDKRALIGELEAAIAGGNLDRLTEFWTYFRARVSKLRENLSSAEKEALEADVAGVAASGVFLLRLGEIEDYLPNGVNDVRSVVEFVSDRNWINVLDAAARMELAKIGVRILEITGELEAAFMKQVSEQVVAFPAQWRRGEVGVRSAEKARTN